MTFDTKRKRLKPLQEDKCVEWGQCGAGVAQYDGADTGDESGRTGDVGENGTVVTRVGCGESGEFIGVCFPIEVAGVDDYATEA